HAGAVNLDRLSIGVPYQDKSNVARWSGKTDVRCRGNTWFIPYETIQSRSRERPHPATFPVQLAEQCLKIHGLDRINLAMDPFLGIGAAGMAGANLGVAFVGFEMDPRYFEVARQRIADAMRRRSRDLTVSDGLLTDAGNDSERPEI
ncbi:MAG: site-specific DNA-methyltransferase, partial [Chloroflexi bacterium]|nr:site-specific DNA-methyltransferase [Chloroflexota bacterium]